MASASAPMSASTNVLSMERSRSGSARSRCSARKRARSILGSAVIVVISFRTTVEGLLKDHAVAVFYVLTTRASSRPSYTTSVDLTGTHSACGNEHSESSGYALGTLSAVSRSRVFSAEVSEAWQPFSHVGSRRACSERGYSSRVPLKREEQSRGESVGGPRAINPHNCVACIQRRGGQLTPRGRRRSLHWCYDHFTRVH
jgi:hypothetical protein